MPRESGTMGESSNRARVSPYPLRSSRTKKYTGSLLIESDWEDVRCVICFEPPHKAVLLTCSSSHSGCRPYMCGTSVRHTNCFKQFCRNSKKKCSDGKTLHCPLCRGEVLETTQVEGPAKRFMNSKSRSCPGYNCEFSGTYAQLDKHLKTEHPGLRPLNVDPERQARWETLQRNAEHEELMNAVAAGIPHMHEVLQPRLFNNHHPLLFQANVNGTVQTFIGSSRHHVGNQFGPANNFMPTFHFYPINLYRGWTP